MDNPFQYSSTFLIVLISCLILGVSACEDPGPVGSDIGDSQSEVASDTLILDGVQAINLNSYSGELQYFSAGQYADQLFGNLAATGYLKPALPVGDSVETDAKVLMQLMYNPNQVYGDTTATQGFELYEIDQLWRDRALMINDELQLGQKLGDFTIGTEDSLTINLSNLSGASQWVDEYREYINAADTTNENVDSTYRYESHGLALVPNNSEKVTPLFRDSTRFLIQNPESDTLNVPLSQGGYYVNRDNNNALPEGSVPLYSTFESVINFNDFGDLSELNIQSSGIARAELVLYENTSAMDSGPASVRRAEETTAYLQLANPDNLPEDIDPGVVEDGIVKIAGSYSSEDNTYRFNVTNLVDRILISSGFLEDREFFVNFPNDGIVKSSVIYTDADDVPAALKPKIIITSLKNQ